MSAVQAIGLEGQTAATLALKRREEGIMAIRRRGLSAFEAVKKGSVATRVPITLSTRTKVEVVELLGECTGSDFHRVLCSFASRNIDGVS